MRIEDRSLPRFITFCCDGRKSYFASEEMRDVFADQLSVTKDRFSLKLDSWVLMPNHVHLILQAEPEIASVTSVLTALKTRTAERILPTLRSSYSGSAIPHLWLSGGGYDRVIRDANDLAEKAAYIELNPVRKGMVASAAAYRWSSAGSDVLPGDPWWG